MRLRRGFYKIALNRLKRLDIPWLIRQGVKFYKIKSAYNKSSGMTSTGPIIAHIFLTNRCNLRCIMCKIPNYKAEYELTTTDCRGILDQLKELGTSGVSFTGGEPLLREDVFELIQYSKLCGMDTMLVTNGLLLDRYFKELIKIEPTILNISLDSSKPQIHDNIRGLKGAFEKTTANIQNLVRKMKESGSKTDVVISTVFNKDNINTLDQLLNYCYDLGISRVILCPVHNFDRERTESTLEKIECNYNISEFLVNHKLRHIIDNSDYYLSHLDSVIAGKPPPIGCPSGYTTIFFDWEYNVYPCKAYLEMGWGMCNLRKSKKSLKEIWYSSIYNKFRTESKTCQKCFLTVNREFDSLFR
jgi:MoaA/NifB/PqqE/SkfB family radical SAM enzyme